MFPAAIGTCCTILSCVALIVYHMSICHTYSLRNQTSDMWTIVTTLEYKAQLEGRKEMFYLTTHSTHFIYGYMASDIWLRTILIGRKKPASATYTTLSDQQQGFFYMHHPSDRIAHTTAFVTPVVEHWLEREIAQWVHPMKDRSDDPSRHERTLLPRSYILLQGTIGI